MLFLLPQLQQWVQVRLPWRSPWQRWRERLGKTGLHPASPPLASQDLQAGFALLQREPRTSLGTIRLKPHGCQGNRRGWKAKAVFRGCSPPPVPRVAGAWMKSEFPLYRPVPFGALRGAGDALLPRGAPGAGWQRGRHRCLLALPLPERPGSCGLTLCAFDLPGTWSRWGSNAPPSPIPWGSKGQVAS